MLILTRRIGEVLVIGDDITVTILSIRGAQVRLGVEAPKSVSVHRAEVFERIADERKREASEAVAPRLDAALPDRHAA